MQYPIPLETARLITRPVTAEDKSIWSQFLGDAEATRYFPNPAQLTPEAWADTWIERQLGRYANMNSGLMALIDKVDGAFIGQCGLLRQTVDDTEELEVGYHIFPMFWRRGYASEAAVAFRDYGFRNSPTESIISIIHRENVASQGVAIRNGMQREKATRFIDMDVYVYRIWRSEWERLTAAGQ